MNLIVFILMSTVIISAVVVDEPYDRRLLLVRVFGTRHQL